MNTYVSQSIRVPGTPRSWEGVHPASRPGWAHAWVAGSTSDGGRCMAHFNPFRGTAASAS